ncbi:hypothetical protein JKF63_00477 [Porcisia hertigi]|uniref:Uncharacterized protein n=1 Tax=Porcisia hertigi TaxID=2761500 RepID=A0A836KYD0_9TRYP|nr:hypothetical protein JKF63_00477 [Porcisia hertigi]
MLKRNSLRLEYTRYFMRWLAFTQSNTSEAVRSAIRLRQDVPLRSKADFLALARRYFAKWRASLRERKQRTVTNVGLLVVRNQERLCSRTLLKWCRFQAMKRTERHAAEMAEREEVILALQRKGLKAVHEAEDLRNELDAALQQLARLRCDLEISRDDLAGSAPQRQTEVNELREAMQAAIEVLEGPSSLRLRLLRRWGTVAADSHSVSDTLVPQTPTLLSRPSCGKPPDSARQSKDTAEALLSVVNDTLASLALAAQITTPPASLNLCVAQLGERLTEEAREVSVIKAQRDELVSAAEATRATLAAAAPQLRVGLTVDSDWESSRELSLTPSRTEVEPNTLSLRSARRTTGGTRRTGALIVTFGDRFSSEAPVVSGTTAPTISCSASPPEVTLSNIEELPRLLVEEAKALAESIKAAHQDNRRYADEVKDLQDAALRAIDVLGGCGAANANLIAESQESTEARIIRSSNIATSLRNLCEDMFAVLVQTSLWSGKGASDRVSEALERLWHRSQDLEASQADNLQQLEEYTTVVRTSAAILRSPSATPPSTMSRRTAALLARRQHSTPSNKAVATPEQVDLARHSAEHLASKGDHTPTQLIELCLQAQQQAIAENRNHRCIPTVMPYTSDPAVGGAEGSRSGPADPPTTKVVATPLTTAATVVTDTLGKSDEAPSPSLLDALLHASTQVRRLENELAQSTQELADAKAREEAQRSNHEAKLRQLQAELSEVGVHGKSSCEAYKKQAGGLEKALSASTTPESDEVQKRFCAQLTIAEAQRISNEPAIIKQQEELIQARAALNKAVEAKKQMQAELRKSEARSEASEQTFKKQLDSLDKSCSAAEAEWQQQVKALQHESARSAENCKTLENTLRELEEDNQRKNATLQTQTEAREVERREHAEALRKSHDEVRGLREQLLDVEEANRRNNAVGVFLRDVLRDCLARLHHLTRRVAAVASQRPPPESLMAGQSQERSPPALTLDSDPFQYVEYVLRLYGRDSIGKRLVQTHLREDVSLHGLRTFGMDGRVAGVSTGAEPVATPADRIVSLVDADPSTWEVVAELHNRLVLLYDVIAHADEKAEENRVRISELVGEKEKMTADMLAALAELKPWSSVAADAVHGEHHSARRSTANATTSLPENLALRTSCAEMAQALEEIEKGAALMPLLEMRFPGSMSRRAGSSDSPLHMAGVNAAGTKRLLSLVADVQNMAHCLQHLSESVVHGIFALGGMTDEIDVSGTSGMVHSDKASSLTEAGTTECSAAIPLMRTGVRSGSKDHSGLAARLEAICKDTGTSVQEVRRLLCAENGGSGAFFENSAQRGDGRPVKLSDMLPAIVAKMYELQEVKRESEQIPTGLSRALHDDDDDDSCTSTSSMQRSLKPKQKPLPVFQRTPEAGLRLMQQQRKGPKKKTLRRHGNLASVLRDTQNTLRMRISDMQNLRLVCRSTLEVLEGSFVKGEYAKPPPTNGESLEALLKTQIEDLRQALPETEEALAGCCSSLLNVTISTRLHLLSGAVRSLRLQCDSLKEELARRGRQSNILLNDFKEEVRVLRTEIARREEEQEYLERKRTTESDELNALRRNAAELAPLQRERDALCDALAQALRGLPGTPCRSISLAGMHQNLLASLKVEHGKSLAAYVEAALRSAYAPQKRLHEILRGFLHEVRGAMKALRAQVAHGWQLYGQHVASAVAQQLEEMTEVLTTENDMLRPRAIEREQLKRDKAQLEAALADAMARLENAEDENTQLRRAVRDAQVAQALANLDDDDSDNTKKNQVFGNVLGAPLADWERRMIDGATELTMSAVDSMSGTVMSAASVSVVEETLHIYSGVRRSLKGMESAYAAARGKDERYIQKVAAGWLQELDKLSQSADHLWMRLPVLRRVTYQ